MAVVQIPNLPAAIALSGSEQLEAVQAGTSVRVTVEQISRAINQPANPNLSIQFNSTGVFGGSAGITTDGVARITLGVQQTTQGSLVLANTAAGAWPVTIQSSNSATAAWTMTLPPAVAAGNGFILTSNTSGVTSWTNPTALGIDLDVGTTAITNGTVSRLLFQGAGDVLQQSANLTFSSSTLTLGVAGSATGAAAFTGATSGTATITAQAAAGSPTLTLPNASGTLVSTASAPLSINATTGAISITGAAGQVLAGATPAFTATPTLGVAGTTAGTLALSGATSGTVTLQTAAVAGTGTIFQFPSSNGASGTVLTTTGSGVTTWTSPSALGIDLDVGSTAITNGTAGCVLFQGTGNVLQQSSNLFWDNTNGRFQIGYNVNFGVSGLSSSGIQLTSTVLTTSSFQQSLFNGGTGEGPRHSFLSSRGSSAVTYTSVVSGDTLGELRFAGADGTAFIRGAAILSSVDGTPATNSMPGRLAFSTTASGSTSPTERMRITSAGAVNIVGGGSSGSPAVSISGSANSNTLVVDASSNTGVGTSLPVAKLHVFGGYTAFQHNSGGGYPLYNSYFGAIASNFSSGGSELDIWNTVGSGFAFRSQTGVSAQTCLMYIGASGNVGINNVSPAFRLTIGPQTGGTGTATPDTISLGSTFSNAAGANAKLRLFWEGTIFYGLGVSNAQLDYMAPTGAGHVWYIAGAERMRLGSAGAVNIVGGGSSGSPAVSFSGSANSNTLVVDASSNVGIGTASPSTYGKLSVFVSPATAGADGIYIPSSVTQLNSVVTGATYSFSGVGASQGWIYTTASDLNIGPYGSFNLKFIANNLERMRITNAGAVSIIGAGSSGSPAVSINGSANSNTLVVDASSRVGLGRTPTNFRLEVAGNQWLQDATQPTTFWGSTLAEYATVYYTPATKVAYFGADGAATQAVFASSGTERIRLTSSGDVNIKGAGTAGSSQAVSFSGGAPINSLVIDASGNILVGTATSPTTGTQCLTIETGTAPTATPADTVTFYSTDLSAGNTIPSIYTEGTDIVSANAGTTNLSNRIAVRINGTVYYLLAASSA